MKSCRFLVVCSFGLTVIAGTRGVAQVTSVRSGSERFDRDSARAATPPPEILQHLSPGQLRYFQRALEQMQSALLRQWHSDWWNGEIDDMPPCGVWAWDSAPDDPRSLTDPDVA